MSERAPTPPSLDELVQATAELVAVLRELVPCTEYVSEALRDVSTAPIVERADRLARARRLVAAQDEHLDLLLSRVERVVSAQIAAEVALSTKVARETAGPICVRRRPL